MGKPRLSIRRPRNMRALLTLVHRWAGLAMAGFLLVASVTGSLLAWLDELEVWLAPETMLVSPPTPDAPPLEPFDLQQAVRAQLPPSAQLPWIPLHVEPGRSVRFNVEAEDGSSLPYNEVYADPYTGRVLDKRTWADLGEGSKNLMGFIYRLHYSLTIDRVGTLLLGIVALIWTIDCFVGAYLTFPSNLGKAPIFVFARHRRGNSWLARWWPAWKVRWNGNAYKMNFHLHRAGGLWLWAMLFVLAWSSVAFNLNEVYTPVTRHLLGSQPVKVDFSHIPARPQPYLNSALTPQQSLLIGRHLMSEQARAHGFVVLREEWLGYDAERALYSYIVTSDRDVRERYGGNTRLFISAIDGRFLGIFLPTGAAAGDTFTTWITAIHMAAFWGWPMKLAICVMGVVITGLTFTGVIVWWRKRSARRRESVVVRRRYLIPAGRRRVP